MGAAPRARREPSEPPASRRYNAKTPVEGDIIGQPTTEESRDTHVPAQPIVGRHALGRAMMPEAGLMTHRSRTRHEHQRV